MSRREKKEKKECGGYFVFVNDSSYEFDFSLSFGFLGQRAPPRRQALSDDFVG